MPIPTQLELDTFRVAIETAPLAFFRGPEEGYSIIPASIDPLLLPNRLWYELQNDASLILSALQKVGSALRLHDPDRLLVNLSPLEKESSDFGGLATARLDLFFDGEDLLVIEANTTIPAMQAYSDMIKTAFLKAFHPASQKKVQSNTLDLLHSLLKHYERTGGRKSNPRLAIVARDGDSQLAELLWLQNNWIEQGYETLITTPEAMDIRNGQLWIESTPIDLTYRHIFAHRLPEDSPFAKACLQAETYRVFNPIAAHLEAKGVLAELSRIAAEPQLSRQLQLNEDEVKATLRRVAWSRLLHQGSNTSPSQDPIKDFVAWVKEHQNDLVVKSSLGYGGKGIFIGDDFPTKATQESARQLLNLSGEISWTTFIDHLVQRGEGQWIVQKKVSGRKVRHRFWAAGKLKEEETYIDCSIFTSSGHGFHASGGACRFSTDTIVNLGRGGGLMPFLIESEV